MMEQKSSLDQTSSESFFFFNPRTPCGVRQTGGEITWTRCWFQSTHSLRSATGDCASYSSVSSSFNPRTPCGVRLNIESSSDEEEEEVSIHALLAECDQWLLSRGYTPTVSIHALLAECDSETVSANNTRVSFNPRTPCGVRQYRTMPLSITFQFQSTHSLRSATCPQTSQPGLTPVSIHALLAECDHSYQERILFSRCFNPRTPCGVRLPRIPKHQILTWFQSTHSLRSATVLPATIPVCRRFQSTHSLRSATLHLPLLTGYIKVSIHALLAECDLSLTSMS